MLRVCVSKRNGEETVGSDMRLKPGGYLGLVCLLRREPRKLD